MNPEAFRDSPAGRIVRSVEGEYWAFVPNSLPPKLAWTPSLVAALSDADRALGELSGLGRSIPNPHLLMIPFVRREAVLSKPSTLSWTVMGAWAVCWSRYSCVPGTCSLNHCST